MRGISFNEDDYLEKLWTCYEQGVRIERLDSKELFIALVQDLIKELKGSK